MRRLHDLRGEAAIVEMSIILPLVSAVLVLFMIFGLRAADGAIAESLCEKYASLAAHTYAFRGYSALTVAAEGKDDAGAYTTHAYSEPELYRYLTGNTDSLEEVRKELTEKLEQSSLIKYADLSADISLSREPGGGYILVTVKKNYAGGGLLSYLPDTVKTCRCRVNDFAELTRTGDFAADAASDIAAYIKSSALFKGKDG